MTPEERDRLARLETHYEHLTGKVDVIDEKVDQLLKAAAMGQGAWWALLKVGGVLSIVASAAVWVYNHLPGVK